MTSSSASPTAATPLKVTSTDHLNDKSKSIVQLYNADCMLNIHAQVAAGYVVLLGGAPDTTTSAAVNSPSSLSSSQSQFSIDDSHIILAFMALTEGNAVDACFGVETRSAAAGGQQAQEQQRARKQAQITKALLGEAVYSSESIRRLSVETYRRAFQHVVKYRNKVRRLNCITFCIKFPKIQAKTMLNLKDTFAPLEEAIQASTKATSACQ